jgi:AraC-like DNA-binding protein
MEVRVPNKSLAVPGVMSDAVGHASIIASAERQLALQRGGEWVGRVRQRLLERTDAYPTLAAVARDLSVSSRTLLRHLKRDGATYQGLLDEVRKEAAAWYLAETQEPIETIAARLGYADASNFSRSFRRWFGTPPAAFRRARAAN